MKLYTEEQVRVAMSMSFLKDYEIASTKQIIESLKSIELPSDEEIGVIALNVANTLEHKLNSQEEAFFLAGFQTCAKWVIEQIKQQANENTID